MQDSNFKKESPTKTTGAPRPDPSMNRRTPRRDYDRLAGILIRGKYSVQKAIQIGEGGMMIELPSSLKSGDLILISLVLPKSLETLVGRAEILYQKEKISDKMAQTGVKFINLETSKRRAIRDFVSAKPAFDLKENRGKGKNLSKPAVPQSAKLKKAS